MNKAAVVPLTIFLTLHPHSFCRAWNLVSKLVEVLRSLSVLLEVLTCSGQGSCYSFKARTYTNTHLSPVLSGVVSHINGQAATDMVCSNINLHSTHDNMESKLPVSCDILEIHKKNNKWKLLTHYQKTKTEHKQNFSETSLFTLRQTYAKKMRNRSDGT